jgi:hypothetical protein
MDSMLTPKAQAGYSQFQSDAWNLLMPVIVHVVRIWIPTRICRQPGLQYDVLPA